MSLSETLYAASYCLFVVGAARSHRDNGGNLSVVIMSCGVLLDFLISMLPLRAFPPLK